MPAGSPSGSVRSSSSPNARGAGPLAPDPRRLARPTTQALSGSQRHSSAAPLEAAPRRLFALAALGALGLLALFAQARAPPPRPDLLCARIASWPRPSMPPNSTGSPIVRRTVGRRSQRPSEIGVAPGDGRRHDRRAAGRGEVADAAFERGACSPSAYRSPSGKSATTSPAASSSSAARSAARSALPLVAPETRPGGGSPDRRNPAQTAPHRP